MGANCTLLHICSLHWKKKKILVFGCSLVAPFTIPLMREILVILMSDIVIKKLFVCWIWMQQMSRFYDSITRRIPTFFFLGPFTFNLLHMEKITFFFKTWETTHYMNKYETITIEIQANLELKSKRLPCWVLMRYVVLFLFWIR